LKQQKYGGKSNFPTKKVIAPNPHAIMLPMHFVAIAQSTITPSLVVQLKSIQVQASELGNDYHTVYLALGDASNSIWFIYRKQQNIMNAKKQSTAKQTSMKHFLKNKLT